MAFEGVEVGCDFLVAGCRISGFITWRGFSGMIPTASQERRIFWEVKVNSRAGRSTLFEFRKAY